MLEALLWIGAGLWTLFFIQLILNRALSENLSELPLNTPEKWPFVSIVVPARNEERGIQEAVSSFCAQDYPGFEVIVVDDGSTDDTSRILEELKARFSNLKVIRGHDPPEGWLGKPNALETGRKEAKGDWLLFVDADVIYAPGLLRRAMAYAIKKDAGMLFLGPNIITKGVMEPVIMSSLYLVASAFVPIFLVTRSRSRLFAVGGGTFNLVRRDALDASGAFESLKDAVVDDVGLGYRVKGAGFNLAMARADRLIRVRMYRGAKETIAGFTKNIYPFIRKTPWLLLIPFVGGFIISLLPYFGFANAILSGYVSVPASISLFFMHTIMAAIAITFRQPWHIIFLNPVRELCWWWILSRSLVTYNREGIVWRGRRYGPLV